MTREKALKISNLLTKIESYEALIEEIRELNGLAELSECFGDTNTEDELVNIVQGKLDVMLKELDALDDVPAEHTDETDTLVAALEYFAGMYGFAVERNDYDGNIEYSCNGYVVDEDTFNVLDKAKDLIDWWEVDYE